MSLIILNNKHFQFILYSRIMDNHIGTITQLHKIQSYIFNPEFQNIFVLLGNSKAGKKTLIHYMMESELIFEVDEDGQDVLNIQNQAQKIVIIQNLIQLIPYPQKQSLFIKIEGFNSSSKTPQQKMEWSLTFDLLLQLLSMRNVYVKFILIFSLQQLQDDDQIFVNYYRSLKNVQNYVRRTHLVLSKVYDEEEVSQFREITAQNIKQSQQNCQYIDQIIKQERLIGFYCREVDQDTRNELNQKIMGNQVDPILKLTSSIGVTYQNLHSQSNGQVDIQGLYQRYLNLLKASLTIINYSLIQILFKGLKANKDQDVDKGFKEAWKKVFGEIKQFQCKNSITQKKNLEQFIKTFQQLIKKSKTAPQQLLQEIVKKFQFIFSFYSDQLIKKGLLAHTKVLIILCQGYSQKNPEDLFKNEDLINVFVNHQNGCFEDHYLLKVFQKVKPYLSPQFAKGYEKLALTPVKKKKIIKKIKSKVIPNFQQQKKAFLAKNKNAEQIQNLLDSPLKLDLLIEQLQKIRKSKTRNIMDEKKIIKSIYKILQIYGGYEEAARFSWILPNNYLLSYYLIKHIKAFNLIQKQMSQKDRQFVEQVCKYFMLVCRSQYVEAILRQLTKIEEESPDKKEKVAKNLSKIRQSIQKLLQEVQTTQSQQELRQKISKEFMNYNRVNGILKNKKQLIEKCINFQAKNSTNVQLDIALKWILTASEFKVTVD